MSDIWAEISSPAMFCVCACVLSASIVLKVLSLPNLEIHFYFWCKAQCVWWIDRGKEDFPLILIWQRLILCFIVVVKISCSQENGHLKTRAATCATSACCYFVFSGQTGHNNRVVLKNLNILMTLQLVDAFKAANIYIYCHWSRDIRVHWSKRF